MNVSFKFRALALAAIASSSLSGCGNIDPAAPSGDGEGGAGGADPGPTGSILPWAVGNEWTYRVTKAGVTSVKTTTIGELEAVGGDGPNASAMAYHVTTAKGAQMNDHTESWQAPSDQDPERIVRYREQSFSPSTGALNIDEYWDPEKLHVDGSEARTRAGATWLESYSETQLVVGRTPSTTAVRERWTVVNANETLQVPAGSFDHVIHLQKAGSGTTKNYWYRRGVGKLKETGTQIEELTDYKLKAAP